MPRWVGRTGVWGAGSLYLCIHAQSRAVVEAMNCQSTCNPPQPSSAAPTWELSDIGGLCPPAAASAAAAASNTSMLEAEARGVVCGSEAHAAGQACTGMCMYRRNAHAVLCAHAYQCACLCAHAHDCVCLLHGMQAGTWHHS